MVVESNDLALAIGKAGGADLALGASLAESTLWPLLSGAATDLWARAQPTAPTPVPDQLVPFDARLLRSRLGAHLLWIREPSRVTQEDGVALGLTLRQAQIALLLVDGLTNEQIGHRLRIATGTVRK